MAGALQRASHGGAIDPQVEADRGEGVAGGISPGGLGHFLFAELAVRLAAGDPATIEMRCDRPLVEAVLRGEGCQGPSRPVAVDKLVDLAVIQSPLHHRAVSV